MAPIVKAFLPYLLTDSLRAHFEGSVESLISLVDPNAHRLVLAHLFQPHLPFLWDADGTPHQGALLLAGGEHLRGTDRDDGDDAWPTTRPR